MDNKIKYLCVAIAVLLASNGYLLYRLGNAEGKTESVAKANIPIGKYIPEGDGLKSGMTPIKHAVSINKINLRGDNKVEINEEIRGVWKESGKGKGYYIIECNITTDLSKYVMDYNIAIWVMVDDKHLSITGFAAKGNDSSEQGFKQFIEKDFIRYKRVE